MRGSDFLTQSALLEAPGDFLSELLAVCAAGTLSLRGGALLELPADTGMRERQSGISPAPGRDRMNGQLRTAPRPGRTVRTEQDRRGPYPQVRAVNPGREARGLRGDARVPAPTIPAIRRVGARQAAPEGTTVRTSRTAGSPDRPGRIRLVRIKTGRRIPQEEGFALRIRDRKETAGGPIIRTRDVFPRRQLTGADPAGLQASGMAAENSIVMRARRAHRKRL